MLPDWHVLRYRVKTVNVEYRKHFTLDFFNFFELADVGKMVLFCNFSNI